MKIAILINEEYFNTSLFTKRYPNISIYTNEKEIKNAEFDLIIQLEKKIPCLSKGIQLVYSNYKQIDEKVYKILKFLKDNNFNISKKMILGRKKDYYCGFIDRANEKSFTESYYSIINLANKKGKIGFLLAVNEYDYNEVLKKIIEFFEENITDDENIPSYYYNRRAIQRK